ncbi:hypothetical protein [Halorarum salinum]|uniref:Uncharacterized protein n=1 Tax=Halorarum salinum TaxID=2743089 RepID=A0A7D5QJC7_9EURY|nr:hypothetical protein [Halobaculum salinum]QLG61325.1 hypothetical protein HUG12_06080 [Halobaculum salinum]
MKRRGIVSALPVGILGSSAGRLSRAREATACAPPSRFGVLIENHRGGPQSVSVEIETGLLGRNVFSKTFEVPAATDAQGHTYHPEVAHVANVLTDLRSHVVSVLHGGETATHSWRVTCNHLYIRIDEEGHASPAYSTLSPDRWERITSER